MKKQILIGLLVLSTAWGVTQAGPLPYEPGALIVKFANSGSKPEDIAARRDILAKAGGATIEHFFEGLDGVCLVKLPSGISVQKALTCFGKTPGILYAEPNYRYELFAAQKFPNDPMFDQLWAMHNVRQTGGTYDADIDAPEAWAISTDTPFPVIVAVLDTGIDYTHPDLAANMWHNIREYIGHSGIDDDHNQLMDDIYGYDFLNGDAEPNDDCFHGTHVAGTIGAVGNNGIGVTGVCWSVQIMTLKVADQNGPNLAAVLQAIAYAIDKRADIINASWGSYDYSQALYDAIADADANGILLYWGAPERYFQYVSHLPD